MGIPVDQAIIDFVIAKYEGIEDKGGDAYVHHLARVADGVAEAGGSRSQYLAAWLHDIVEDDLTTFSELAAIGAKPDVLLLVHDITRQKTETYANYIQRVKVSDAKIIKLCDLHDNLSVTRLAKLSESSQQHFIKKYTTALKELTA